MGAGQSEWGLEIKEKLPRITKGDFFVLGGVIKRKNIFEALTSSLMYLFPNPLIIV